MTMEELPPKTLKTQLVRLDQGLKQIERKQFAGIQRAPGSLPVLEAFEEFLDNERKQSKRRIVALCTFFVLLLLVTAGAGAGVVYWQMQRMASDYDTVKTQTAEIDAKRVAEDEATRRLLATLESRLGDDSQRIIQRHEELLSAHTTTAKQVTRDGESLSAMMAVLQKLAGENLVLKDGLERIVKEQAASSQARSTQAQSGMPEDTRTSASRDHTANAIEPPVVAASTRSAATAPSTLSLTIVPPGELHGIRWRLPAIQE
jgi:hypothetical protein